MQEGLSPGERQCLLKYKPVNWDEPFHPDRHNSLFSSVTWGKNFLCCYECVSSASDLCWTVPRGQSGWSCASVRPTWALEQAQAPLTPGRDGGCAASLAPLSLSLFIWWLILPCSLWLLYLLFDIAITFHLRALSCSKKQWMAGYIMPIFPQSSSMKKKVFNFSFPSLSREMHWIVLMQHHWPASYTASFAFSLLSHHRVFLLVIPFCIALCTPHHHITSPSTNSLSVFIRFHFLLFPLLPSPTHPFPWCLTMLILLSEPGQKAASLRGFIGRLCRDSGPISAIRSSLNSSKDDRVCTKDY